MKYPVIPHRELNEELDLGPGSYWFLDVAHSVPPYTPMFGYLWATYSPYGMQYGAEKLSLPTISGADIRFKDGGIYIQILHITDPAEIQRRSQHFRVAIRPFLEDFDGLWERCKQEMMGRYQSLKQKDLDAASNFDLQMALQETWAMYQRMWENHMYLMYGVFSLYILFEEVCQEHLGMDDTSPDFFRLLRGFDNQMFRVNRQLWVLAQEAERAGLAPVFEQVPSQQILAELEGSGQGRSWAQRFREFLDQHGWRMQRFSEINEPTWLEDPTPPLQTIRQYLLHGLGTDLEIERQKLAREREEAERLVLARIPPSERAWFTTLMRVAQKAGIWAEEHNYYLDLYAHALIRRTLLAIGRRLVASGAMDEPDHVLFLTPPELEKVLFAPSFFNVRPIVDERRSAWESWCARGNPLLISPLTMEEAAAKLVASKDPVIVKGVMGNIPRPDPDAGADLFGVGTSPGVAEGVARVILDESQLDQVRPGDILVAAATSPGWSYVFSYLSGVIVEQGGSLSHPSVVGREYGIPVLVNVFDATKKIRTGQRLRIDANRGHIFFLDPPGHTG